MIRQILKPTTNQVVINIPSNMVNQKLELLLFPIKQDTNIPFAKKKAKLLMEKVFKNAESIAIQKDILSFSWRKNTAIRKMVKSFDHHSFFTKHT